MALVDGDTVGMAIGFLNPLRGAVETLVIAAYSASLVGLLTFRLGGAVRAAEVGAGRLTGGAEGMQLDAFTWSWRVTQAGVGLFCVALSVAVGALIPRPSRGSCGTT